MTALLTAPELVDTISTVEAAELLDVAPVTVWRWARHWHGPVGAGGRIRVSSVDMLVFAAWKHINGDNSGCNLRPRQLRELCDAAEGAIRRNPNRWLALSPDWCDTFATAELAAAGWWALPRPRPAAACIDLWRRP